MCRFLVWSSATAPLLFICCARNLWSTSTLDRRQLALVLGYDQRNAGAGLARVPLASFVIVDWGHCPCAHTQHSSKRHSRQFQQRLQLLCLLQCSLPYESMIFQDRIFGFSLGNEHQSRHRSDLTQNCSMASDVPAVQNKMNFHRLSTISNLYQIHRAQSVNSLSEVTVSANLSFLLPTCLI